MTHVWLRFQLDNQGNSLACAPFSSFEKAIIVTGPMGGKRDVSWQEIDTGVWEGYEQKHDEVYWLEKAVVDD